MRAHVTKSHMRGYDVSARVTFQEREAIRVRAGVLGMSIAAYVRACLLLDLPIEQGEASKP